MSMGTPDGAIQTVISGQGGVLGRGLESVIFDNMSELVFYQHHNKTVAAKLPIFTSLGFDCWPSFSFKGAAGNDCGLAAGGDVRQPRFSPFLAHRPALHHARYVA